MATAAEIRAAMDKVTNAYQLGTPTKKSKPKAPKKAPKKAAKKAAPATRKKYRDGVSSKMVKNPNFKGKASTAKKGTAANPYKAALVKGKSRGKKSSRSTEARLG